MIPLCRTLLAAVAAASLSACLAPVDDEAVAVAIEAFQLGLSPIPWSDAAQRFAAPPPVLEPEPSAVAETKPPPAPAPAAPIPTSAGAVLFTQIAACRQSAQEMGGGMANARAMLCLASVLRGASSM